MTALTLANDFVKNMLAGMNLSSDTFKVALSNTASSAESNNPLSDGNGILGNITEVGYTYCSSRALTISSFGQASGVMKWKISDKVLTAGSSNVGPFRYVYVYDDTVGSPAKPVVGVRDYGSAITLASSETLTISFTSSNVALQIS